MQPRIVIVALFLCGCASAPKAAAPAAAVVPQADAQPGIPDRQLGLSKTSVFEIPDPAPFAFPRDSPGGNDKFPRAYPGAPPAVPHDVSSYLPITAIRNRCVDCHNIEKAVGEFDPTPIPASHHVDWRNSPGVVRKEVAGARWVCSSCHVPQAVGQSSIPPAQVR